MTANPSYPATDADVRRERARMAADPTPLARPVVVLGGWRSPFWQAANMARRIAGVTSADPSDVLAIAYFRAGRIGHAARLVCEAVAARWPSAAAERTVEVDVVGVSMGGLVARAAAAGMTDGGEPATPRLCIRRLFTLGTPHRGARLAMFVAPDPAARDMRPGSAYLAALDEAAAAADYELIPYARTRDGWVGATRTAPPGAHPIWTEGPVWLSHMTITWDDRILVDIARRLRGEPPLARGGSPPPTD